MCRCAALISNRPVGSPQPWSLYINPHFTLGDMRLAHVLQRAGAAEAPVVPLLGS